MTTFRWRGGWDPLGALRLVQQEMDRLLGLGRGLPGDTQRVGGGAYPAVNVFNGPEEIVVQFELAGVNREDMDLSITGETLAIKGVKRGPENEENLRFHRRERGSGEFSRTVVLPDPVDAGRIDAKFENGILLIRLAKSESARPKHIQVK